MQITKEIFQVGGGGLSARGDAAVYLIKVNDKAGLVDAGTGRSTDRIIQNIRDNSVNPEQIRYLLVTHCHFDHTGGAKEIKALTGCQIIAHELEAPFLEKADQIVTAAKWYGANLDPFAVDRKIKGQRERITLGGRVIEAIHIPGHSPGSMAFVMESEGFKVLFGQDVHGPLDARLLSDRKKYNQSLKLMLSLEADILCEGHYGVVRGKEQVRDFISSFVL